MFFGRAAVVAAARGGVARAQAGSGGGARHHAVTRVAQRQAGHFIHQQRLCLPAGLRVDELHGLAFRGEVAIAPVEQREQHGTEAAPAFGKQVFEAAAVRAVLAELQQAALHQLGQATREHVGCDGQALLELLEAAQSEEGVAQDQHAPPLAHLFQAPGDRALHAGKALALHDFMTITMKVTASYNYHNESQGRATILGLDNRPGRLP